MHVFFRLSKAVSEVESGNGVFVCACVWTPTFWASGLVNTAAVEWK